MAKIKPTKDSFSRTAIFIDNQLTTRKTKFTEVALLQVANQINEQSLPLLRGHDSALLPSGRWYEAKVSEGRVLAKFFIPKEVPEHDEIKAKVESNVLDSVSIGFTADKHTCSICGHDIQDYENCPHIPGKTYDGSDCFVYLEDIHASEGSLVYAGAVPGAKIQNYAECEDKKSFCEKFAFSVDLKEIVKAGEISHEENIEFEEDVKMDLYKDKFLALEENYADLAVRHSDSQKNVFKLQDDVNSYKVQLADLTSKVEAYKASETATANGQAEVTKAIESIRGMVEKFAAPFEATYTAPTQLADLLADLEKYSEKAKALPTGQQSLEPEETKVAGFQPNDDVYKI